MAKRLGSLPRRREFYTQRKRDKFSKDSLEYDWSSVLRYLTTAHDKSD